MEEILRSLVPGAGLAVGHGPDLLWGRRSRPNPGSAGYAGHSPSSRLSHQYTGHSVRPAEINTDNTRKQTQTERRPMCLVLRSVSYALRRDIAYFRRKKSRSPSPSLSHRCQTHASSSSSTIVPTKYRPILQPLRPLSGSAPPRRRRTAKTPAYPSRCRFHKRHAPSAAFPSTYRRNACTSGIQHLLSSLQKRDPIS